MEQYSKKSALSQEKAGSLDRISQKHPPIEKNVIK